MNKLILIFCAISRYDDYSQRARLITEIHAQATKLQFFGEATSSHNSNNAAENEAGPTLSKKSLTEKNVQDKKKEKLIKEKKRILKRL